MEQECQDMVHDVLWLQIPNLSKRTERFIPNLGVRGKYQLSIYTCLRDGLDQFSNFLNLHDAIDGVQINDLTRERAAAQIRVPHNFS